MNKKLGIGVGLMIYKNKKVLLGLRNIDSKKASSDLHGEGTWTFPGGKLDFGESIYDCAKRELKEETNLDLLTCKVICINNNIVKEAQYITFGILVNKFKGKIKTMERDEITEWKWFKLDKLPKNLYSPTKKILDMYKKKRFFDIKEK